MTTQTLPRVLDTIRRRARPRTSAGARFRLPLRQIRWQIILPYAFLVVVLASVATYMASSLVQGSLNERFENQLVQASRVSADSVVRLEDSQLQVGRSVAFTDGLPQAIESRQSPTVSNILGAIAANTASERIDVLDAQGRRIAGVQLNDRSHLTYGPTSDSLDNPAKWPLVGLVLNDSTGAKYAQIVDTSAGSMLMTATPVLDGDKLTGVVLVGTSLQTLVAQMKAQSLADLTLYDFDGNPLASTFILDPANAHLNTNAQTLNDAAQSGSVVRESRTIWGRDYNLVYGSLIVRGRQVGFYSVALPSDFIFDAAGTTRLEMALFFGLGMALVLFIGFVLARIFTRRIQQLVLTAELVTAGDLSARTKVDLDDELGRLATCLNRMTDRLEGQYMATMRALASAVAGRNPYTVRHSFRVGQLATMLGRELGVDERTLARLEIGGYLHDIGLIGVRHSSVMRSEVLAPADKKFIHEHPHIGLKVPEDTAVRRPVMDFIGLGPAAEADDDHIVSRITAVADLYDALTADRPHGDPMSPVDALNLVRSAAVAGKLHLGAVEALARIQPQWDRSQGRGSDYARLKAEAEA